MKLQDCEVDLLFQKSMTQCALASTKIVIVKPSLVGPGRVFFFNITSLDVVCLCRQVSASDLDVKWLVKRQCLCRFHQSHSTS
jgi:hypothetical protein